MSEASLALQIALRKRLIATPELVALVPAKNILDRNARPNPTPSIIIGEDQVLDSGMTIARDVVRIHSTVHVWATEEGLQKNKAIVGVMWVALSRRLNLASDDFECADCNIDGARYIRDPDGTSSHGIVNITSMVRDFRKGSV